MDVIKSGMASRFSDMVCDVCKIICTLKSLEGRMYLSLGRNILI